MVTTQPTVQRVWEWLAQVPDPEIPVISVTELGIVRQIAFQDDLLIVTVTPTYSGCPATALISELIESHLKSRGVERVRIEQRLSPPWTTDWMTDEARRKLKAFGIAPPLDGTAATGRLAAQASRLVGEARLPVACPRCDSTNTEKISQFGSTPCKASYRCKDCLEPFDYFKCI